MVSASRPSPLFEATREVEAADHILGTIYPLSRDPRALLGVLEHELRALEHVLLAVPDALTLPGAQEATSALVRITRALAHHAAAPTVFTRGDARVIADATFCEFTIIDPQMVAQDLQVIKRFVHEAHKRVALGK